MMVCSIAPSSLLLLVLAKFRNEVRRERRCSYLIHVFDSFPESTLEQGCQSPLAPHEDPVLIYSMVKLQNRTTWPDITHFGACSVTIHANLPAVNSTEKMQCWKTYPVESMSRDFHIFIAHDTRKRKLFELGRSTRKIVHAFILVSATNCACVYKLGARGTDLVPLSMYCSVAEITSPSSGILEMRSKAPNLKRSPIQVCLRCPDCDEKLKEFERTGKWADLALGTVYELAGVLNGTLDFHEPFSTPKDGPDEDGQWDAWTQPLIDGSGTISAFIRLPPGKAKVLLYTRAVAYDSIGFITRKPQQVGGYQKLPKLLSPFGFDVWLALIASILGLFVTIEILICTRNRYPVCHSRQNRVIQVRSRRGEAPPKHLSSMTLSSLLSPVVSQPGITHNFQVIIGHGSQLRFLLAVWLAALIVLMCSYTTTMTSNIVLPLYNKPPSTFEELADSGYKIFAELWTDNLEIEFASLNKSFSKRISAKVIDTNVLDNEVQPSSF